MRTWSFAIPAVLLLTLMPARSSVQAATPSPEPTPAVRVERHPRIRSAIRELQAAKSELQKAPHDFGGHRADAVAAVDKAIEQLRIALQYDRK